MKLESSLPERPGLLHAVPVLDLFALVWLLFLLSPSLLRLTGVAVELPPSRFQLERYPNSIVVTLGPGEGGPRIHLGREAVTPTELATRLDALRETGAVTDSLVLLQTDAGTPVGTEREISELVIGRGFRLALVGAATGPRRAAPPPPQPGD